MRLNRPWRWLLAVIAACVALAAWAVLVEPRWVAQRHQSVHIQGWKGPAGLKVAVAADWHLTKRALWRVMTVERAQRIVQDINAARPDIVLLPGDFIADPDYQADGGLKAHDEIASVLGALRAPLGVYAVLGNHDWWEGGAEMANALQRQGIRVLENDAQPVPGADLWVVGVGDDYTGHSRPKVAVAKLPSGAHTLTFMHDPASLLDLPPVKGLVVAAHTHGGQVYLPFLGALVVPGRAPTNWAYGWVEHELHRMYVTSGLGVSILPLRFNMRPEWVLFEINAQPAKEAKL